MLRTIALACNANWDLVAERMHAGARPAAARRRTACSRRLDELVGRGARLPRSPTTASPPAWPRSTSGRDELRAAPDEYEQLRLLTRRACRKVGSARAARTTGNVRRSTRCARSSAAVRALVPRPTAARWRVAAVRRLAWEIAQFTLREAAAAPARRASSSSTTCSCSPVRCCATRSTAGTCAQRLRARYTRLLLDEFQDTDPIQCDLAVLLASADPDAARPTAGTSSPSTPGACSWSATPSSRSTASGGPTSPRSSRARDSAFGDVAALHLTRNFRTARAGDRRS